MTQLLHTNPQSSVPYRLNSTKIDTRWRPTRDEVVLLRTHYKKNKYPTIDQKNIILKELNKISDSTVNLAQLNNWFQKERVRTAKDSVSKSRSGRIYTKFSKAELDYLARIFEQCMYPTLKEMIECAKYMGVKLNKVENWFKHTRRAMAKDGQLALKARKYFGKEEMDYIQKKFDKNSQPSKAEYLVMAEHLQCDVSQVKNWFANRRKKMKTAKKGSEIDHENDFERDEEAEVKKDELTKMLKIEANELLKAHNFESCGDFRSPNTKTAASESPLLSEVSTIRAQSMPPLGLNTYNMGQIGQVGNGLYNNSNLASCLDVFHRQMNEMAACKLNGLNNMNFNIQQQHMQSYFPPHQPHTQDFQIYKKLQIQNSFPNLHANLPNISSYCQSPDLQKSLIRTLWNQNNGLYMQQGAPLPMTNNYQYNSALPYNYNSIPNMTHSHLSLANYL